MCTCIQSKPRHQVLFMGVFSLSTSALRNVDRGLGVSSGASLAAEVVLMV